MKYTAFFLFVWIIACAGTGDATSPLDGDLCDDPDAPISCCFVNMPQSLTSTMRVAAEKEPGDRLVISGVMYKADGRTPYPNVILYVYQTDNTGHYSKKGNETGFQKWHGHLHGWCQTDSQGRYQIHSIRPAPYPDNTMPAHIHAAVKKPDPSEPYYLTDFVFADDPLVNAVYLSSLPNVGGTGVVKAKKSADGIWVGQRNIVLTK